MAAAEVDIELRTNETFERTYLYLDGLGNSLSWVGYEAALQVRNNDIPEVGDPDSNVVMAISTTDSTITIDEDGLHISIAPSVCPPEGIYRYDLRLFDSTTYVVPQYGKFKVKQGVTTYEFP